MAFFSRTYLVFTALAFTLTLVSASIHIPTINFTTYRVTPIQDTGMTNMDTGDQYGDVYFGLAQMLLPQLCVEEPSFLWCENRAYLSGGKSQMVYSEFVVTTRDAFGEYQPCNPCSGQAPKNATPSSHDINTYCPPGTPNGTFVCSSYSSQQTGPPQCQFGYEIWHQDCLNGTIYHTLTGLNPQDAEGACCAACSADNATCAGWNMPDGDNGTVCQLMRHPLLIHEGGQLTGKCKAAVVDPSSSRCWYDDQYYNTTFNDVCDRANCTCEPITAHQVVGRELSAMCHQDPKRSQQALSLYATKTKTASSSSSLSSSSSSSRWISSLSSSLPSINDSTTNYWKCSDAVSDLCFDGSFPSSTCSTCAQQHMSSLSAAGCTPVFIEHLCSASYYACEEEMDTLGCLEVPSTCNMCAAQHTSALELANCTTKFVEYTCMSHGSGHRWNTDIDELACVMNGTWYSTAAPGLCEDGVLTDDCWWFVAETKRTVNASCVDGNVVKAVEARRPACWQNCTGVDATNSSSACFLSCLYETLLGNKTTGLKPMSREEIVAPFLHSFESADVHNGGCPDVIPPN
eukprot:m.260964 g.260964  ORF g.260964 m.260964 type:complete len:572 (+) comp40978_c0_seq1:110-1825(+)